MSKANKSGAARRAKVEADTLRIGCAKTELRRLAPALSTVRQAGNVHAQRVALQKQIVAFFM
jgi:hypothetical protein